MARKKTSEEIKPIEESVEIAENTIETVEAEVVKTGIVTASLLNIRRTPSIESLPIGTLAKGTSIEYTVENDEWLKLEPSGGFVMKQFVQ